MTVLRVTPKWTLVKTGAYSAALFDSVPCDTTGGTFAVTLPTVNSVNGIVRVKWRAGAVAPTVVAAVGRALDATWAGFAAVGDSADFSDDGTTWNLV